MWISEDARYLRENYPRDYREAGREYINSLQREALTIPTTEKETDNYV